MLHFFETEILRLHVQRPIQPMRRQFTYWCCWWSLDYCVLNDLKRLECNNNNICVWIFAIIACGPNKSGFVAYAAAAGSALNHVSFVSFGLMFWVSDSWATVDAATSLLHFGWRGDVEKKNDRYGCFVWLGFATDQRRSHSESISVRYWLAANLFRLTLGSGCCNSSDIDHA